MNKSQMLDEIKAFYNFTKDSEFARFLEITPQTLSNWKKRNSFDAELVYTKCEVLNPAWLLSGKGNMLEGNNYSVDEEIKNLVQEGSDPEVLKERLLSLRNQLKVMEQANKALEEANESLKETKAMLRKRIEELEG